MKIGEKLKPGEKKRPNPFYMEVLRKELAIGSLNADDRILVVCGGNLDRVCLLEAGFRDVVISNLAPHGGHNEYAPYIWRRENIEGLSYEKESFDVAIVHSGLHHCYNPYRGLGEICRVARKMVIAFEPYQTWFTVLGAKIGYGQQYEDQAVHGCGGQSGGAANTDIPNYVYRFKEEQVEKFSRAFFPFGKPEIRYYRALRINKTKFIKHRNAILRYSFRIAYPVLRRLAKIIPSMNNNLCFVIERPGPNDFHPWIYSKDGNPRINKDYLIKKYGKMPQLNNQNK